MDISDLAALAGHGIAWLLSGGFVMAGYRWVRRRSRALGAILAAGILIRVALALALFWISFLELPVAKALQIPGGFWSLAPDARGWYLMAMDAADSGQFHLNRSLSSPVFVRVLAIWMIGVGVSPAAAAFLNLCLYVGLMAAMVRVYDPVGDWRRDLPCIIGVAALSCSPVVVIHSTQPLKEVLFCTFVAAVCLGVLGLRRLVYGPVSGSLATIAAGAGTIAAATLGISGIRWYYTLMVLAVLAAVLALFAVRGRRTPLSQYLAGSAAVLAAVVLTFWFGGGPNAELIAAFVREAPSQLVNMTKLARVGFLTTGGATNLVVPLRDDPEVGRDYAEDLALVQRSSSAFKRVIVEPATTKAPAQPAAGAPPPLYAASASEVARAIPISGGDQLHAVATGLATVFVPLSIVTAISGISLSGGRGLLPVAELDTIFQDVSIALVLLLLWRRRRDVGGRLPLVVFGLALSVLSAALLGYVVTNFGTLWRLRTLVAVPAWMVALAVSPRESPRPFQQR